MLINGNTFVFPSSNVEAIYVVGDGSANTWSDIVVSSNRFSGATSSSTAEYLDNIASGGVTGTSILNNDFTGISAPIALVGSSPPSLTLAIGNIGYNPTGSQSYSVAITSGAAFTLPFPYPVLVVVTNATSSSVSEVQLAVGAGAFTVVTSTTLSASGASIAFAAPPNAVLKVTFTGTAPTVAAVGL